MKKIILSVILLSAPTAALLASKEPSMDKCELNQELLNNVTPDFIGLCNWVMSARHDLDSPTRIELKAALMEEFHSLWAFYGNKDASKLPPSAKDGIFGESAQEKINKLKDAPQFNGAGMEAFVQDMLAAAVKTVKTAKAYIHENQSDQAKVDAFLKALKGCAHHSMKRTLAMKSGALSHDEL